MWDSFFLSLSSHFVYDLAGHDVYCTTSSSSTFFGWRSFVYVYVRCAKKKKNLTKLKQVKKTINHFSLLCITLSKLAFSFNPSASFLSSSFLRNTKKQEIRRIDDLISIRYFWILYMVMTHFSRPPATIFFCTTLLHCNFFFCFFIILR